MINVEMKGFYYLKDNLTSEQIKAIEALPVGTSVTAIMGVDKKFPNGVGIFTEIDNQQVQFSWIAKDAEMSGSKKLDDPEITKLWKSGNAVTGKLVAIKPEASGKLTGIVSIDETTVTTVDVAKFVAAAEREYFIVGTGIKQAINPDRYILGGLIDSAGPAGVFVSIQTVGTEPWIFIENGGKQVRCCQIGKANDKMNESAKLKLVAAGFNQPIVDDMSELMQILNENDTTAIAIGRSATNDYLIKITAKKKSASSIKPTMKMKDILGLFSTQNKEALAARISYLSELKLPETYLKRYCDMWAEADGEGFVFEPFKKQFEDVETMGTTVMTLLCQEAIDTGNIRLVGPKGCGKNMAVNTFASLWGFGFLDNSVNAETASDVLIGAQSIQTDENGNAITAFKPSSVIEMLQKKSVVNLDEVNLANAGSLMAFQPVLDGRRYIDLPEVGKIKRHIYNVILTTMNEGRGYAGTRIQNEAFVDRFATIYVPGADDILAILMSEFPTARESDLKVINSFFKKAKKEYPEISIRMFMRTAQACANGNSLAFALKTRVVETMPNLKDREKLGQLLAQNVG